MQSPSGVPIARYTLMLQKLRMCSITQSESDPLMLESIDFISDMHIDMVFVVPIGAKSAKEPDLGLTIEFKKSLNTLLLSGEQMIFLMRTGTGNFLQPVSKVDSMSFHFQLGQLC